MGTTIEIDEATRNAILAALDERAARLEAAVAKANHDLDPFWWGPGHPGPEDVQRALVWNIAALHETNMARLQVAEAGEPVPTSYDPDGDAYDPAGDPPEDQWLATQTLAEAVPWEPARSYHDYQSGR